MSLVRNGVREHDPKEHFPELLATPARRQGHCPNAAQP